MLALQKLKFYHRLKRSCNDTAAAAITTAATSRPTSTRTYFFLFNRHISPEVSPG